MLQQNNIDQKCMAFELNLSEELISETSFSFIISILMIMKGGSFFYVKRRKIISNSQLTKFNVNAIKREYLILHTVTIFMA